MHHSTDRGERRRHFDGGDSNLAGGHQSGEVLEAAVVGALGVLGKAAGGQFPHPQVIRDALAAKAFATAWFVAAVAAFEVFFLAALHR
jgi:hypothetical protein